MEELLSWPKLLFIWMVFLVLVLKVVVSLWWRPRRIEDHFSRQGIRGPPYRFFIGNVKELGGMMLKASSQPMPFSHNILPRVLSFYHHWKKIYGIAPSSLFCFRWSVTDTERARERKPVILFVLVLNMAGGHCINNEFDCFKKHFGAI